jgi:hypothetical protein
VKATGAPSTVPCHVTRPYLVRSACNRYEPAVVPSATVGRHALRRSRTSIGRHCPRQRYAFEFTVGMLPSGSHSGTAYVSVMS